MLRKINDAQNISLDPCPFCGKDVADFATCQEVQACENFRSCDSGHYLTIVCSFKNGGCGASSGFWPSCQEAANAWNRKTGYMKAADVKAALVRSAIGGNADTSPSAGHSQ